MRSIPVLSFLTLTLPAQFHAADATARANLARAMKVIPVADLVAVAGTPTPLPFGSLIEMEYGDGGAAPLAGDPESGTRRIHDLSSMLRTMTPLPWDDGVASVDQVGDSLILTGAPDQIHLIEQSLQRLTAVLGSAATVRAALFTSDRTEAQPVVAGSYADLHAALAKACGAPAWEGAASAHPGQIVELGVRRITPYVSDCDVEIAQSSALANPVIRGTHDGTRIQVQIQPLAGSADLVLFCHFALGETRALRAVSLGPDRALPTLQSPEMATSLGTASARLANGGALAVQLTGVLDGRSAILLVGAERPAPSADAQRDAGMWPIGAFLSHAQRMRVERRDVAEDDSGLGRFAAPHLLLHEEPAPMVAPGDADLWVQMLQRAIGEGDSDVVMLDNGYVMVRGDAAAKQAAARLIEAHQEQFLRTVEVEHRTSVEGERGTLRVVRAPSLLGRFQYTMHGIETTAVLDAEVEVAQKAGISDPKVRRQFSGIVAVTRAYPGRGRDVGASVDVLVQQTATPIAFAMGTEKGITLQHGRVSAANFRRDDLMPVETIDLGETDELTVGRERFRARQSLTLRMR